jgi:hypothetical protein
METKWSPATLFDRAMELRRRLLLWHVHNSAEPPQLYDHFEAHTLTHRTLREIIREEKGQRPNVTSFTCDRSGEKFGSAESVVPTWDRSLTVWLLRDFSDHLPDAGQSNEATILSLAFGRSWICLLTASGRRLGISSKRSWSGGMMSLARLSAGD